MKAKLFIYIFMIFGFFIFGVFLSSSGIFFLKDIASFSFLPVKAYKQILVGNSVITEEDLEFEHRLLLQGYIDINTEDKNKLLNIFNIPFVKDEILSSLIERKVLYNNVVESSFYNSQTSKMQKICVNKWRSKFKKTNFNSIDLPKIKSHACEIELISYFLTKKYDKIILDESEIVQYYNDHKDDFHLPKQVQIRHILLGNEKLANKLRYLIKSSNFIHLLKKHSIAPEINKLGLLDFYSKDDMPSPFKHAFLMKTGEVSGLLTSGYGFHFFRLEKVHKKKLLDLANVRSKISNILIENKKKSIYSIWLNSALENTKIEFLPLVGAL